MILMDSDVLIEIYDKESDTGEAALERIRASGDMFCITAINLHEVLYGLIKYAKPSAYLMQLPVLDYSKADAELAAELEVEGERKGKKLSRTDAMIASIAINNNAKLYTNNRKHFEGVNRLALF